ncbi:hypothetical protein P355_3498 [Burkholderia cenocepacia KC-01]|nr:hypothetical protein P355_3498 [Burkholderia cenocepacia KC-01]
MRDRTADNGATASARPPPSPRARRQPAARIRNLIRAIPQ